MDESDYIAPLDLYISFDYLPIEQQARILSAINGVYSTVSESQWPDVPRLRVYYPYSFYFNIMPPLCIVSAHTGDSIQFKFDIERKILPKIKLNGEKIEIFIPYWTAAVILTGAFLTGGMHEFHQYLDIKKSLLEIKKLEYEVQKLQEELSKKKNSPIYNKLQIHLNQFFYEINKPNIQKVIVNDHLIKGPDNVKKSNNKYPEP